MSPREKRDYLRDRGWRCTSIFGSDSWNDPKWGGTLSLNQAYELETKREAAQHKGTPNE